MGVKALELQVEWHEELYERHPGYPLNPSALVARQLG